MDPLPMPKFIRKYPRKRRLEGAETGKFFRLFKFPVKIMCMPKCPGRRPWPSISAYYPDKNTRSRYKTQIIVRKKDPC